MTETEPVSNWDTVAKTGPGLEIFSRASAGDGSGCDFGRDFDTAGDSRGDLRKGRGDFLAGGSRFGGNGVREDIRGDLRKGRGDFLAGGSRFGDNGVRDFDLVWSSHFSRACFS